MTSTPNNAIKAAIEKYGLGRANSAPPYGGVNNRYEVIPVVIQGPLSPNSGLRSILVGSLTIGRLADDRI